MSSLALPESIVVAAMSPDEITQLWNHVISRESMLTAEISRLSREVSTFRDDLLNAERDKERLFTEGVACRNALTAREAELNHSSETCTTLSKKLKDAEEECMKVKTHLGDALIQTEAFLQTARADKKKLEADIDVLTDKNVALENLLRLANTSEKTESIDVSSLQSVLELLQCAASGLQTVVTKEVSVTDSTAARLVDANDALQKAIAERDELEASSIASAARRVFFD
ncbi:hypothetical protein EIP91_009166 [Steccherinum ochraceum]|uniref:Uncharacterized protein n=1 Tax=Steccherinum ochraceum TaxID=92696 RepID=A0A4R0R489_9APHY|nr:hypothetical protein EIP91_009166 [Steccherinum ochraceum]